MVVLVGQGTICVVGYYSKFCDYQSSANQCSVRSYYFALQVLVLGCAYSRQAGAVKLDMNLSTEVEAIHPFCCDNGE